MSSSLIPEKPLQVSPSLAATIGLEEATMLSVLDELMQHGQPQWHQGYNWLSLDEATVTRFMPFWSEQDIQRICKNLSDKGILLLASAPYGQSRELRFAFNEQYDQSPAPGYGASGTASTRAAGLPIVDPQTLARQSRAASQQYSQANPFQNRVQANRGANLIDPNWQPGDELMRQIAQHNIPEHFIREQLPEFVTYWRERGEAHHSWSAKFLKQVKRNWVNQQSHLNRRDQEVAMHKGWRPSPDALDILTRQAAINPHFIEDAIPEFVLYWQERGDVSRAWNSKFIQHVRLQWNRYTSALEHDTEPKRIPENWQPNEDVYDMLRLANIDLAFARQLVPEFVLFWRDSNKVYSSWNTKFLQHAKYHWAKRHALTPVNQSLSSNHTLTAQAGQDAGQQNASQPSRTRDRSLVEDLTDRSWAN